MGCVGCEWPEADGPFSRLRMLRASGGFRKKFCRAEGATRESHVFGPGDNRGMNRREQTSARISPPL